MGTRWAAGTDGTGGDAAGVRLRATVGGAIVLLLVAAAAAVLSFALNAPGGSGSLAGAASMPASEPGDAAGSEHSAGTPGGGRILVHVLGQVAEPGLYELVDGARLVDAVAAAGGFTTEADRGALNLARVVSDGEQVYAPAVGEAPPPETAPGSGAVNLNTADASQLETLPGVGPQLAQRILTWRAQNGRFASVDDLLGVPGIGEKTLSGLVDLVTT